VFDGINSTGWIGGAQTQTQDAVNMSLSELEPPRIFIKGWTETHNKIGNLLVYVKLTCGPHTETVWVAEYCSDKTTLKFPPDSKAKFLREAVWSPYEEGAGYYEDDFMYTLMYVKWVVGELNCGLMRQHYYGKETIELDVNTILRISCGKEHRSNFLKEPLKKKRRLKKKPEHPYDDGRLQIMGPNGEGIKACLKLEKAKIELTINGQKVNARNEEPLRGLSLSPQTYECSVCLCHFDVYDMRTAVPCGHRKVCKSCAERVGNSCPICRAPVLHWWLVCTYD